MQNVRQAIRIARIDAGWSWQLLNDEIPAAAGAALAQEAAMENAWRAARESTSLGDWAYPEITVERLPPALPMGI